eukprot:GGOE01053185.1.p1 GENE.GGOE01053185.1~~GGOE01053185.1.p1  ORF type:complete len:767 (+),score=231.87 GGOE01053185.1:61-2361(+)
MTLSVADALAHAKEVVADFMSLAITVDCARHEDTFADRIADPSVAVPVLGMVQRLLQACGATKVPNISPRFFLSAYLCLGPAFLDSADATEGPLYQSALDLLVAFEDLCQWLVDSPTPEEVPERLAVFLGLWRVFAAHFHGWKKEDARRLIAHYIAAYVQVERARRALLLEEVHAEVPAFLHEVRRQLSMVGGQAALEELDAQLRAVEPPPPPVPSTGDTPVQPAPSTAAAEAQSGVPASGPASSPPSPPKEDQSAAGTRSPQTLPTGSRPTGTVFARLDGSATPPRVVELTRHQGDVLRDAYSKARLAHEAVCDVGAPDPQSAPDPLREIAEKAFWDVLRAEVSAEPPQYARVGALVQEASLTLQDCLPRDVRFREELESALDWTVLERTLSPELLRSFASYMLGKVMELEAPVHGPQTQALLDDLCAQLDGVFRPELVVTVFRAVMDKLRQLKAEVDVARRNLAKLRLRPDAVALQQNFVATSLALGRLSFTVTRAWLDQSLASHFPARPAFLGRRDEYAAVVREGLLELLQTPQPVTVYTVPETLALDVSNIVHLQNRLQHVTLVACLVNLANMVAQQRRWTLTPDELLELKGVLDTRLAQPCTTLPDLTAAVTGFLSHCAASRGVVLAVEDIDLVSAMLGKTTNVTDPVFAAFRGKLVAALSRLCRVPSPPDGQLLFPTGMLHVMEADVRALGRQVGRMLGNTLAVYGAHYFRLVNELLMEHEARVGMATARAVTPSPAPTPMPTSAPEANHRIHPEQDDEL